MIEVKKIIPEIEWHDLHHTNTINFRFIADTKCLGLLPQLLLYREISCPDNYAKIQSDVNNLSTWVNINNLTLNGSKCMYMIISRLKWNSVVAPVLTLYNNSIKKVSSYKYLGVIITDDLLWSAHIEQIASKAKKIIGLIYHQFYSWTSRSALLQLYTSLVRPHLEYATQVWNPHLNKDV